MSKPITAIIVDDEIDARNGLEFLIKQTVPNLNIIAKSENAQNALEIIIDKQPEIVFLDIQMPINDGFWLAKKLNKLQLIYCEANKKYRNIYLTNGKTMTVTSKLEMLQEKLPNKSIVPQ